MAFFLGEGLHSEGNSNKLQRCSVDLNVVGILFSTKRLVETQSENDQSGNRLYSCNDAHQGREGGFTQKIHLGL